MIASTIVAPNRIYYIPILSLTLFIKTNTTQENHYPPGNHRAGHV